MGLDANDEIIGYEYVNMGVFMDAVKKGVNPEEALNNAKKNLTVDLQMLLSTSTHVTNRRKNHGII